MVRKKNYHWPFTAHTSLHSSNFILLWRWIHFFTSNKISQISLLLSPQIEILGNPQRKATEAKIILQISLYISSKPNLGNIHKHK